MNDQTKLYEAFYAYVEACVKLNKILWDSVASVDLLKSNQKESHFIRNFESTEEFKNLTRLLFEHYDYKKPNTDDIFEYSEYKESYEGIKDDLHRFFANTGIYDRIIPLGGDFNKERAYNIFLEELEKDVEEIVYGEVFPLKTENKESPILEFKEFSLTTDLNKYDLKDKTPFVFLVQRSLYHKHKGIIMLDDNYGNDFVIHRETPFSELILVFNLYFDKPVYMPEWWRTSLSLFSSKFQPQNTISEFAKSVKDKFYGDLDNNYIMEAGDAAWATDEDGIYYDWDRYHEFMDTKLEEYVNSDKAPMVNYLKEAEIKDFKEFIIKIREFLRSDSYRKHEYLKVATHYFLMGHEKPDIADNLINYVIALESLYFAQETSEMKERLANRIANLLGKTLEEKSKIREEVLQVYNLRCKYVHGKTTNLDKYIREKFGDERWFNDWLRNLLRISILSFYSLGKYYDSNKEREKLLENLDSVFDPAIIEDIQKQANDFKEIAMPYNFLSKIEDNSDIVRL